MFATPLLAAPMAGGTTTPALSRAAAAAGALPFVPAGYLTPEAMAAELAALRAQGGAFGVNVFVPRDRPLPSELPEQLRRYRQRLLPWAERLGVALPDPVLATTDPRLSDYWEDKLQLLLREPVPFVSFTFGLAAPGVVARLRAVGTRVLATVTTVAEARAAAETGVDALVLQHPQAGGHSGAFLPAPPSTLSLPGLVAAAHDAVPLPLVAAGGIGDAATARLALSAGASAVQLGTALLRTAESGARATHKAALADPRFRATAVSRAFTGRPARALRNDFLRAHDTAAPAAFPEVHFLTAPLRAAAAARGEADALNLWAGTAWRLAGTGPAARVIDGFLRAL